MASANKKWCYADWNDDLWDNISQELKITWPQTEWMDWRMCYMQQIVFRTWFFNKASDFDIILDMWNDRFKMIAQWEASSTEYIKRQNISSWDWSLWTSILWLWWIWWWSVLQDNISKMSVLWFKVWIWFTWYFKMTLSNKNNSDINLSLIEFQYIAWNPYMTPRKNTF